MAVEPTTDALLAHVVPHLPAGTIRLGRSSDAIDGVCPRIVAEPTTRNTLSQVLEWAATERLAVSIRGGGTKLTWGRSPAPIDLALRVTGRANGHAPVGIAEELEGLLDAADGDGALAEERRMMRA